ncbi:MAG: hypothetical protein H0T69_09505 [Thermoleophilaceae bacterium]|nr:hypothetical protein [Thermoleophilaceae bacterium]
MLAGPAAVVVGVVGIAWFVADRAAARGFYRGFANAVGLSYASRAGLLTLTPLLGAGSSRRVEHWMYGRLPGELSGGVGQLVWERIERDSDGDDSVRERNRFTICTVDLEASLSLFRGVYLHPRRGLFAPYSDWLGRTPTRTWRWRARSSWRATSCAPAPIRTSSCCAACSRQRWSAGSRTTR